MGADFVACDFCVVCSRCESRGLPTNPSTGTRERICARRERECVCFYTLSLSPYLLIVSVDLLETSKIEKKRSCHDAPPPFFFSVSHSSIYHHFEPSVSSISFLISLQQNPRKKQKEINRTSRKRKHLRLFIADSSEKPSSASCT